MKVIYLLKWEVVDLWVFECILRHILEMRIVKLKSIRCDVMMRRWSVLSQFFFCVRSKRGRRNGCVQVERIV